LPRVIPTNSGSRATSAPYTAVKPWLKAQKSQLVTQLAAALPRSRATAAICGKYTSRRSELQATQAIEIARTRRS